MAPHRTRELGVRELRNGLNRHVERVSSGEEIVVTKRGKPVARLIPVEREDPLAELRRRGIVSDPSLPAGRRRVPRLKAKAPVSELIKEQRR